MAITSTRGRSQSKFYGYVEGGPELAAALNDLDKKVRNVSAKEALQAGGRLIADEWAQRVPIGTPPHDPHPGAYRRSLEQEDAVKVSASKYGATGSVRPGFVDGIDAADQPAVYAAVLEFRDGEPSARPAFDSSRDHATQAVSDVLAKSLT